ncbi:MAG: hypothetical protein ACU0B1_05810 [Thermohalobaculum sp.]
MHHRFLLALTLLVALGACKPGGNAGSVAVEPAQTVLGEYAISASVIDQRPYVVDGEESDRFIGNTLSKWGKISDIKTESGRPLAVELTDELVNALDRRGVAAAGLPLPKGTPEATTLAAFQIHGTERMVAVQIYELRVKAISRVILRWHLEAVVYDRSGNILARRATRGVEPVGRIGLKGNGADIAMREIIRRLSELLDEPVISRALN